MAVITLTTDFGVKDAYGASMKGVILGINPQATLVDLCHEIEPQNIPEAAFILYTSYKYFPSDTIHVVVVDPGVGTERRALVVAAGSALFVAPDNGVLSYILEENPGFKAYHLTNSAYWLPRVSTTFHGRDIFAPVAAHLSLGINPQKLGEAASSLTTFPLPRPQRGGDGVAGEVLHIDRFGNLIANIKAEELPSGEVAIEVGGRRIEGLSPSYALGGELLALVGSSGYLEIAAKNSSAARLLGLGRGARVEVRVISPPPPSSRERPAAASPHPDTSKRPGPARPKR